MRKNGIVIIGAAILDVLAVPAGAGQKRAYYWN